MSSYLALRLLDEAVQLLLSSYKMHSIYLGSKTLLWSDPAGHVILK